MSVIPIQDALPGEDLIGIEPELLQQVDPGWLHRLSLFTGRTLTATALQSEQAYRAGRLAILGQCVTQGTVKGLELSADLTVADPLLQVTPGYGISATGEDVTLTRSLRTTLGSLQVVDPQTGSVISAFTDYAKNAANTTYAGVLLLQPITGQVSGASIDTGSLALIVSGNLDASCDQDPEEYAFQDWQIVDGVRLVLVAWPSSPATLALPSPTPAASWRNRLAYTVFNAEMALQPDDRLPWEMLGVPVALVGFDNTWKAQFVDCSAVVRTGGLQRTRYVLPAQPTVASTPLMVQPALAQARVSEFAEQISALPALTNVVPAFAFLPPCGVLPAAAMDFVHREGLWLPPNWTLAVGPVHQEEVETALLSGMTALPLDVTQNESVEVLVPLPDAVYDPDVLVLETVDPAFQSAVDSANAELAADLQHRKAIQEEANALSQVLTGAPAAPLYNLDAGLTAAEIAARDAQVYTPTSSETFGTQLAGGAYASVDYQKLLADVAKPPYTLFQDGNGNPLATPLPLFSKDDLNDIDLNGLQHFITLISGRLSKANDLLDLSFLTAQSDIYRFRQYVLGSASATALAVSPIAAEIATGESAASTAANLKNYLSSILPGSSPPVPPTTTTPAPKTSGNPIFIKQSAFTASKQAAALRPVSSVISPTAFRLSSTAAASNLAKVAPAVNPAITAASANLAATFTPVAPGSVSEPASTNDVLAASPLVGAQLNLRTLTMAQRLANPPSQEGLFYAVGNRLALLELLADLEITIDDIPILVDVPPPPVPPAGQPTTTRPPGGVVTYPMPTVADLRPGADATRKALVLNAVQTPVITSPANQDPDEASLFSTGIHVLEQHSQLLRAIEARIQQYQDFLTECGTALANIQTFLPQAQTLLTQLENGLAQARQDLTFTTALLNDETQRVANVNAQRAYTLQNYVQVVAFTRPRTLATVADVPARQLVPGNVVSPVPACLQQSVAIPPELREIVALLREAPVNWMPSIQALLNRLERPTLLQEVAVSAQARATMLLQLPSRASSAASEPGVYAPAIANIYSANQLSFRSLQTQRAAFQPIQLVAQSWISQVQVLQTITAINDLMSSAAVHAEVVNATSRLMRQISSVATCVYARSNQALPIHRLAWAEFLRGAGLTVELQSLAILPQWNTQDYVARQQMQMLVDWLFHQIDPANSSAVGFMSDIVRVAILLASDAPADAVINGAVSLATTPKVGGIVTLNLPSDRIAHGMYVHIYSSGVLTAQAVVSDLDSSSVRATVTQVYKTGVALQANDVARFTAQAPQAVALRAFDM
jgi:hypothetical protein